MKELYIKDLVQNKKCELLCWIANKQTTKNLLFLDVYDSTGYIQAIADKNTCESFNDLCSISIESTIKIIGKVDNNNNFIIEKYEVIAPASINITPSPNYSLLNPFEKRFGKYITEHPTFYIRNRQL